MGQNIKKVNQDTIKTDISLSASEFRGYSNVKHKTDIKFSNWETIKIDYKKPVALKYLWGAILGQNRHSTQMFGKAGKSNVWPETLVTRSSLLEDHRDWSGLNWVTISEK